MAKNKKFGVDIIVDDKGTLKQTGKDAKKTAGQFNVLDQSTRQADRAGKGLARTSSNSTKNFSKMSQGISGGLVPAYAVLAANIFALSAAFRFLQDSMDTANMIAGQEAFGSITGIAYQTITKDVQDATEGMLQFKEAASAVAIGIAAGLTGTQLKQLGEAAKNVSLALGRDLTDSFERLIRGVTKAEPELLDELGIVLRLENATRKYALTIGKTREELNAFERTQAVMADVLDQATQKFGRISEIMDPDAFALGQLTKEMDDMLTTFKVLLAQTLTPIFKFLNDNIVALIAIMSVILFPILKAIGPNWEGMYKKAYTSGKRMESQVVKLTHETLMYKGALDKTGKSAGQFLFGARQESAKGIVGMLQEGGATEKDQIGLPSSFKYNQDASLSMKASQQMTQADIDHYSKAAKKKSGIFEAWSDKALRQFHTHLSVQQVSLEISQNKQSKTIAKGFFATWKKGFKNLKLQLNKFYLNTLLKMQDLGENMMKWFGRLQMIMMGIIVVQMVVQWGKKLAHAMQPKKVQRMREETRELTENLKSLNKELDRMNQVRFEGLLYATDGLTQLGNALTSVDLVKRIQQYNREIGKGGLVGDRDARKNRKEFVEMADQLRELDPAFESLYDKISTGEKLTDELVDKTGAPLVEKWVDHYNAVRQSAQALTQYKENVQAVNSAIDKTIRTFSKMPYQDITKQLGVATTSLRLAIGSKELGTGLEGQVLAKENMEGGGVRTRRAEMKKLQANAAKFGQRNSQAALMALTSFLEDYGGTEAGFEDWAKQQTKSLDFARQELLEYNQELERQEALRLSMVNIQQKAIEIQRDDLKDQLKMARVGPGSSAYHKNMKEDSKLQKQIRDQSQAKLDIDTAIAALSLTQDRVDKMIENRNKVGFEMSEDEREALEVENANAIIALENARTSSDIQEQKTKNVRKETDFQKQINFALQMRQALDDQLTRNSQIRAINAAQEARALATTGTRGGRYQLRMAGVEGMRSEAADIASKRQARVDERSKVGAGYGNFDMATYKYLPDAMGKLTDEQVEWNKLSDEINTLTNQHALKLIDIKKTMDEITNDTLMANLEFTHEGLMAERERVYTLNPLEQKAQEMILEAKRTAVGELNPTQIAQIREMAYAQEELNIQVKLMKGIQDTMTEGFVGMFQAMVDGTESFKEGMKKLFADFMQKMADMFAEAVALRLMMNFTGGLFGGSFGGAPGGRSGGIFQSPGYKSFQGGGIASGPSSGYNATLHGNEAVVPLGNDLTIPVKFEKGGGNVSNVTVNVSAGGQQQTTTAKAGERERKLGQMIAAAVQGEILDQQRPGGILSPYGDGGG